MANQVNQKFKQLMETLSFYCGESKAWNSLSVKHFLSGCYPSTSYIRFLASDNAHRANSGYAAMHRIFYFDTAKQPKAIQQRHNKNIQILGSKGSSRAISLLKEMVLDQIYYCRHHNSFRSNPNVYVMVFSGLKLGYRHLQLKDIKYVKECINTYLALNSTNCISASYTAIRSQYTSYRLQNSTNVNQSIIARLRKGSRQIPRLSALTAVRLQKFVIKHHLDCPAEIQSDKWIKPYVDSILRDGNQ